MTLSWMQLWPYAVAALGIGVIAEGIARAFRLWVYRKPWIVLFNLVVMYGLVMGGLASLVPRRGALLALLLGGTVGMAYEVLNLRVLGWWTFPEQRLGFVRGHVAIVTLLTMLWGFVPPVVWALRVAWPGDRQQRSLRERYEDLAAREQHIQGKLRALHEREDQLERALEAVRAKKRPLEDKFEVREPGLLPGRQQTDRQQTTD